MICIFCGNSHPETTACPVLVTPIAPAPAPAQIMGWMCPRCGAVHSPFTSSCWCQPSPVWASNTMGKKG